MGLLQLGSHYSVHFAGTYVPKGLKPSCFCIGTAGVHHQVTVFNQNEIKVSHVFGASFVSRI